MARFMKNNRPVVGMATARMMTVKVNGNSFCGETRSQRTRAGRIIGKRKFLSALSPAPGPAPFA